jgi:riboflavin kinase/FMN adenylyltransferase
MIIDDELGAVSPGRGTVLTIGVFDGVHRGHQHLISKLVAEAKDKNLVSGVVTFREHPSATLNPNFSPRYLTTLGDRLTLLKDTGVDFALPITFDRNLAGLRAEEFVVLLKKHLRMSALVVGPDFAMGRRREGTIDHLVELGKGMEFSVTVAEGLEEAGGETVRSTVIREALSDGDVGRVTELLGRRFSLSGEVVSGEGRGGQLGFPTANIAPPDGMAFPGDGIYATFAYLGDRRMMAATSIGTRPTFGDNERAIEAFILDFDDDLYGKILRVEFVKHLRDQVKFDTIEALQKQVDIDVEDTKAVLGEAFVT